MNGATPSDPPARSELLTGRSLTMREYLEAVLRWVERHYDESTIGREPFGDDDARLADLREYVQSIETRKMFRRFGAGEDWHVIKASTRGGRLE